MIIIPKIDVGTSMVIQKVVKEEDTALNYGSGQLETLLATPSLIALMIEAAVKAVDHRLSEGIITVGRMSEVFHERPTVLGATVTVKVTIKVFDGVRILFDMIAYDEIGMVGRGSHERFIVNKKALLQNAIERAEKLNRKNY